MEVDSGV